MSGQISDYIDFFLAMYLFYLLSVLLQTTKMWLSRCRPAALAGLYWQFYYSQEDKLATDAVIILLKHIYLLITNICFYIIALKV